MEQMNIATKKFIIIPTTPIPSGDIPSSQYSDVLYSGEINLKNIIYVAVKIRPDNIPNIAPYWFILFEKIPITIAGNIDAAAKPKAKATT